MALTFTNVIDGGLRVWNLGNGLKMAQVDMVSSDVSVDYVAATGFDIVGNAAKMGFGVIFDVLSAQIRTTAGVMKMLVPIYNSVSGRLRFAENAAAAGAFDDADVDTAGELVDADVVRMTVIGV